MQAHSHSTIKGIERVLAEKREEKAQGEYIAALIKLYDEDGKKSGCGACVAAFDDQFGAKRNPNAETQLPIERQVLKEILRIGNPMLPECETGTGAVARLQDDPCAPKLETHLKLAQERAHHHHERRLELHAKLDHLRSTRPIKGQDFEGHPHAKAAHCQKVHKHAQAEARVHAEIANLGPCLHNQ